MNYLKARTKIEAKLKDESRKKQIFRKYKFFAYINKQKAFNGLVKSIKETFECDNPILIPDGDWSMGKMRNFISTPNAGLKKMLSEHFTIYNIDEFRTSMLSNVTKRKCSNLMVTTKDGNLQKIHVWVISSQKREK